ncbi:multidrug and toxin extrusion protein 1-like [Hippocampus comes]|uniref:multidrug and toxin extrusion protein 1-like n=1 Tax=Hippocampus comes TaxID=109280 RepID=UPI00094E73F3|nr:PREDICTED: multidrug and toxin extrusion protein 1-like [Hippocampus comes]
MKITDNAVQPPEVVGASEASSLGLWLERIGGFNLTSYRTELILLLKLAGPMFHSTFSHGYFFVLHSLAQLYVTIFMPALPVAFMYQLLGRYLQNQGIIWPQVITGAIANILNAVFNYVFLHLLHLGVVGSAAANAFSQCVLSIILFSYIFWKGLHNSTWGGWSPDCLQEWGPFFKLAMPSMLMFCMEWWAFEVGGCLAGIISEVELGAQSVMYQLTIVAFMFPIGMAAAASVRVGNALGAGNSEQAKLSCKVSIICTSVVATCIGVSITLSRNVIGYIFTTDP